MLPHEDVIRAAYQKAPEHIQQYIVSDDVYKAFYAIRDAYKLHIDHAGNLANAINAVILGLNDFTDLPKLLAEGMQGVDAETQAKVVKDVNDKIFVPLRELTHKRAEEARAKEIAARAQAPQGPRPSIRSVEASMIKPKDEVVMPAYEPAPPVVAQAPVTPATPQGPAPSIIVQKFNQPSVPSEKPVSVPPPAPQAQSAVAQKPVAPTPPPKYHGGDPYRELPE